LGRMIQGRCILRLRRLARGEYHQHHITVRTLDFENDTDLLFISCVYVYSASDHIYVAKTLSTGKKVAIKEMVLAHRSRKDLIVNEILIMKESQHPNIVAFLESYLVNSNELWVVMEYMEGGALTDIIANNTLEEDQISRICLEVGFFSHIPLVPSTQESVVGHWY
jgi:hypothetical protein